MSDLRRGDPVAIAMHVADSVRETEWLQRPWDVGPSKRELSAALAPRHRVRDHVRRLAGRLVKVRAYKRRFPS